MTLFLRIFFIVLSYLVGSIPCGFLLAKSKGIDLRTFGSGNIGATNCGRALGKRYAIYTYVLDVLKGGLLVALFRFSIIPNEYCVLNPLLYGLVAVLGNTFPIFLKFKGGKSVASGSGAVIGYCPWMIIPGMATFFLVKKLSKLVSASSLVTSIVSIVIMLVYSLVSNQFLSTVDPTLTTYPYSWYPVNYLTVILMALIVLIVVLRHTSNIKRILNGTEKPSNY